MMINMFTRINSRTLQLFTKVPKFTICKNAHTSTAMNTNESQNAKFVTVYKFPYIRPFSVINRLKFYQTVLTGVSIPTSFALSQLNFIAFDSFQVISVLGLFGCLTLYSLGFLTIKFIGFIYYNEQQNLVRIAYLDFWGRRNDIDIPTNDVMPINELPNSATDGLFLKFRRYSTEDVFRYNLKYGIVVDKELIKKIL